MITFLALVLAQASLLAQANPPPAELKIELYETKQEVVELPETIVVESRRPSLLSEASPSSSKINIDAASGTGAKNLANTFVTIPGIFAPQTSGEGTQTSLFIRGTNSTQSAILLDGRRLSPGFLNTYEVERYRIYGLSSVEVLRGASSVFYGTNAIGGVVDLRLANPLSEKPHSNISLEGGSYGHGSISLHTVSNNQDETHAATQGTALSLTHSQDDGWRSNSSLNASTALLKSEWRVSQALTFDIVGSGDYSTARLPGSELNPKLNDFQYNDGWLLSPGLNYSAEDLQATAFWSHGVSNIESLNEYSFGNVHQGYELTRDEVTALLHYKIDPTLQVGLGANYECSRYDLRVLYLDTAFSPPWKGTHESVGLWAYAEWKATASDRFKVGLRRDDFTDFPGKTTGEISYARKISKPLTLHVKFSTAYRTPSASELLYGTVNPEPLKPESNSAAEIGLRYNDPQNPDLAWTLVAFTNRLSDLIDYDVNTYAAYNIASARTRGLEFGIEGKPTDSLRTFGSITYLETEALISYVTGNSVKVEAGESLLQRPRLNLALGAELTIDPNLTWGLSLNYLEGRVDYDYRPSVDSRVNLPDATFLRTWLRYSFDNQSELTLRVENILGEAAPPKAFGYSPQPRSAFLGYSRKF